MRIRVHTGRLAIEVAPTVWWVMGGDARDGVETIQWCTTPESQLAPGWRELVVLDPDADAQRLAEAMVRAMYRDRGPAAMDLTEADRDYARAVLDRLAAGTEGEK